MATQLQFVSRLNVKVSSTQIRFSFSFGLVRRSRSRLSLGQQSLARLEERMLVGQLATSHHALRSLRKTHETTADSRLSAVRDGLQNRLREALLTVAGGN